MTVSLSSTVSVTVAVAVLAFTRAIGANDTDTQQTVTTHDVIPVLLLRCAACHGRQHQDGGLDLRTKATILKGGQSGPAVVLGEPENSLILKRIHAEEMPPRKRLIDASVKPMEPGEIQLLTAWIRAGAPDGENPSRESDGESLVTDEDREFWAFQPPGEFAAPDVRHANLVRNAVDAFVLEKLEAKGLSLSPATDRRTLVRRAAFDLTGLPPEPDLLETFLEDSRPDAWERLIDTLLSSRRYGERWGGYWLDRAGYADTEGEREQDILRPYAYRYRDYVIRAFNSDKPYDRFLLEQLAGDELADYENAEEITPEIYDNLVATGFLRMVPDPTWFNVTGFVPNRLDVVADAVDVLGSAVMGLTIKCARCHEHMFDPIPQEDYYSLTAIFKGAYDEHDWLKPNADDLLKSINKGRHSFRNLPHVPAEELRQWKERDEELQAEISAVKEALSVGTAPIRQQYLDKQIAELSETIRSDVRRAVDTAADERNEHQKELIAKFESTLFPDDEQLKTFSEEFKKAVEEANKKTASLKKQRRPRPMIRALWDRGEPSPTYLLNRGSYLQPDQLIEPAALSVLSTSKLDIKPPWPGSKKTGRRLALAKWLVQPDHPLTARVMVNTIWKHHFRHGLVKSLDNFGLTGSLPTHPELLDWLAREFVRCNWSIKDMHRLIMNSGTYRQSSLVKSEHEQHDLDNDLLSRFPMKRMEAEALWDTLLYISGRLDETPFGSANGVNVRADGLVTAIGTDKGWRRSIYVEHNRKQNMTILECFDLPRPTPNCLERKQSTVAPQALHLLNNEIIDQLMLSFADRVINKAGANSEEQIRACYSLALGRPPIAEENQFATETLSQLREARSKGKSDPNLRAVADLCHILINSAEFIYID
ncbi:MAG: PSD1 and planctomycete cytochrome C domain-containing protein [Fuerstiella sp.]|nr:PSD1 and planctomycete cytochrome C domain-containing protein [Fuerstiella sp.]